MTHSWLRMRYCSHLIAKFYFSITFLVLLSFRFNCFLFHFLYSVVQYLWMLLQLLKIQNSIRRFDDRFFQYFFLTLLFLERIIILFELSRVFILGKVLKDVFILILLMMLILWFYKQFFLFLLFNFLHFVLSKKEFLEQIYKYHISSFQLCIILNSP